MLVSDTDKTELRNSAEEDVSFWDSYHTYNDVINIDRAAKRFDEELGEESVQKVTFDYSNERQSLRISNHFYLYFWWKVLLVI